MSKNNFLGPTLQLYTTGKCNMKCAHCTSRIQQMLDMNNDVFSSIIENAYNCGAKRIELFGNDPLLHPNIVWQVRMLNASLFSYAICTVGADRKDESIEQLFWKVAGIITNRKGGFVFSVDYTEETAIKILESKVSDTSYAFKAFTFWRYAKRLKKMGISVRINIVISKYNFTEVIDIINRVAEMGFAVSFCFVQFRQSEFKNLFGNDINSSFLNSKIQNNFSYFLKSANILDWSEILGIISKARNIISRGKNRSFNCFRGMNSDEGEIEEQNLQVLRAKILDLKTEFGSNIILPGKDFILGLGKKGFGCLDLLKQSRYPQMKIGSEGQMIFCCDLHDPKTKSYYLAKLNIMNTREEFLKNIRTNPYIWLCCFFNPCDFSVNRVVYDTNI